MQKASLAAVAAAAVVSLSGCAPSETEIAKVRSHVVETYRHYDSLCVGLPESREVERSGWKRSFTVYPYSDCLDNAPSDAWGESEPYCRSLDSDTLIDLCIEEAESQYFERRGFVPRRLVWD